MMDANVAGTQFYLLDFCWIANFVILIASLYLLYDWWTPGFVGFQSFTFVTLLTNVGRRLSYIYIYIYIAERKCFIHIYICIYLKDLSACRELYVLYVAAQS